MRFLNMQKTGAWLYCVCVAKSSAKIHIKKNGATNLLISNAFLF